VKFVDGEFVERINSLPALIGPFEGAGVDDLRGTVDSIRLETRGGIRERSVGVDEILV